MSLELSWDGFAASGTPIWERCRVKEPVTTVLSWATFTDAVRWIFTGEGSQDSSEAV